MYSVLLDEMVVAEQYREPVVADLPQVTQQGGSAVTEITSGTTTVTAPGDGSRNIELPQALGKTANPNFASVSAQDASGTNVAGAPFDVAGGKGTGNAAPGQAALRYPRSVASGADAHALSANRYPIRANLWTQVVDRAAITGTTTETSLIGTINGTKTIEAGLSQAGMVFHISMNGQFTTSGASSLTIRIKNGSSTLATITVGTLGNIGQRRWDLEVQIQIRTTGATATWAINAKFFYSAAAGGGAAVNQATTGGTATVDSTAAQALDVTAQWGTADASSIDSRYSDGDISR